MQVNPPKMEKFDDVSNMTYLNEASVLWNLKARYVCKLIYVSFVLRKRNATMKNVGYIQLLNFIELLILRLIAACFVW